jgi:hypothetical protein
MPSSTVTQTGEPRRPVGRPRVNGDVETLFVQLPRPLMEEVRAYLAKHEITLKTFAQRAVRNELEREER